MIIPLHTDRPPRRTPIITEGLILLNLLVYLAGLIAHFTDAISLERFTSIMHFDPMNSRWWQVITSMFMHDPTGIWHVAFNMLFLWVFGAPVEDRLGRSGFLSFYLMGGAVAAIAHTMISQAPIIGASGAIAAVTGAFLALFPRSRIVVFFLLTLSVISMPSAWLILLYFAIDVLRQVFELFGGHAGNVAYMAHIAGYVYGFLLAFVLLGAKIIRREEYDVFYMFKQSRRRAALRAANQASRTGIWDSAPADTGDRLRASSAPPAMSQDESRRAEARNEINRLAAGNDWIAATRKYRELLRESPDSVFPEQRQLELANQFYAENDHGHAAAAYELLLERYPRCSKAAEVQLLLGLLYARQLNHPDRAREVITAARPALHEPSQAALADQLLAELTR
jgi:membrane associated rhomboid family serine protease